MKLPSMPEIKVARMPDREDPAVLEARRRRMLEMGKRGGRESTILTDNLMGTHGKVGA